MTTHRNTAPTEPPERLVPDDVPETPPEPATTPDPGPPQRAVTEAA
ncbi:hypothetical protein [Mycolicibacterium gilvum]